MKLTTKTTNGTNSMINQNKCKHTYKYKKINVCKFLKLSKKKL